MNASTSNPINAGSNSLEVAPPTHDFFIGIDSDGCAFDSMEIKQKECFCPQLINHFGLQRISKYARETWEFVNLYSKTRGNNRFICLVRALQMLRERDVTKARGLVIPEYPALNEWVQSERQLANPALEAKFKETGNADLKKTLEWSTDVNNTVAKIVRDVPPFPQVPATLKKIALHADSYVISQTPCEALNREWAEHDIADLVIGILGQEMGTKTEHIAFAAKGKYADDKILVMGDAPSDERAAKDNGVLFYPINPGNEEFSWQRFHDESLDRFLEGSYAGEYEENIINEFHSYLPEKAPWEE
jgi:phosphoglycolate phosphatase-like HAD superfamily hydrolase